MNSARLMMGTAKPSFPAGRAGVIDVVYVGPIDTDDSGSTKILIAVRNNTTAGVAHVDLSAAIRTTAGKLIGTGESQGTQPAQVAPGELALAYIFVEGSGSKIPSDAKLTFTTDAQWRTVPHTTQQP